MKRLAIVGAGITGFLAERFVALEKYPETSLPWAVAEEDLKRRYGP